jgi:ketosteroid isomerase-like protein
LTARSWIVRDREMKALISLVSLAFCVLAPMASAEEALVTADPVIAAERAFAADAARRGWAAAFRSAAAADAITLSPDPVNAQEQLARFPGDGETTLDWRPAYAGVARSGDFGFTTGPFLFRGSNGIAGHYFTVWRRQADGGWKWIFDAGTDVRDPGPAVAPDAAIPTLPLAAGGVGSAQSAISDVQRLEHRIAVARPAPRSQMLRRLAEDVRLNRPGHPAAIGAEAAAALAQATALDAVDEPLRIEASSAGDMVFVLGRTSWLEGETRRQGYLARIWQRQGRDWRIVFDEIVPRREPPPG